MYINTPNNPHVYM